MDNLSIGQINQICDEFRQVKDSHEIWIVANVNNTVQNHESFIQHTNFSEFFTKAEFASIVSAITQSFGYVRVFYSEIEFMDHILAHKNSIAIDHVLVFNFARDGIREGKKALIPALCDLFGINYIGSNAFVVSLLRNKFVYAKYLESLGIPIPPTSVYTQSFCFNYAAFCETDTLIAKHVSESASIGLEQENIIDRWNSLSIDKALQKLCSKMNTTQLIVQKFIEGYECEVFVVNYCGRYFAFSPIEIIIHNDRILTASISDNYYYSFRPLCEHYPEHICNEIIHTTEIAARLLNVKNYARFDYRITNDGEYYLIDIAGSPYLTRHSSISYLFTSVLKLEYSDIFVFLAAIASKNHYIDVNCKSESNNPRE